MLKFSRAELTLEGIHDNIEEKEYILISNKIIQHSSVGSKLLINCKCPTILQDLVHMPPLSQICSREHLVMWEQGGIRDLVTQTCKNYPWRHLKCMLLKSHHMSRNICVNKELLKL